MIGEAGGDGTYGQDENRGQGASSAKVVRCGSCLREMEREKNETGLGVLT